MKLQLAVHSVFGQLADSLCQLSREDYKRPCRALSGNTVGQHVRHIIELFQALENGYAGGLVNYEKRKRDRTLENDREIACLALAQIAVALDRPDKPLLLEASYDDGSESSGHPDSGSSPSGHSDNSPSCGRTNGSDDPLLIMATNYHRELAYNLEHTIHHMAMIRIGIGETSSHLVLPENYGIASSTIKHRKECAQ
jgi:hypothetical protein